MQRHPATALMPFLYDYLLCGIRARLSLGLLLPHPVSTPVIRARRRRVAAPVWHRRHDDPGSMTGQRV